MNSLRVPTRSRVGLRRRAVAHENADQTAAAVSRQSFTAGLGWVSHLMRGARAIAKSGATELSQPSVARHFARNACKPTSNEHGLTRSNPALPMSARLWAGRPVGR
jgi:hypothetical protein